MTTELVEGSAKEFALQLMAQLPAQAGSPLLRNAVRGAGSVVTARIPPAAWPLIEAVWRRAAARGETPSLLLVTSEPWVPWELAWLDEDYVDPALLPLPTEVRSLGALWQVGRWVPPVVSTPRGGDRPASPPVTEVEADAMVVVRGDYASDLNLRPLPEALAEGQALALRYGGMPLVADEPTMDRLLADALVRDGAPFHPTVLHIAAHGQVNAAAPQFSGIILSGGGRRLDALVVQGSAITGATRPFVFLNACQVGTAGELLSEYGGLAGAFLVEGCRGFVAPLWNVDDALAREIAEEFYRQALEKAVPVAEALRAARARFDGSTSTPLAYVFYGHPALTLHRS